MGAAVGGRVCGDGGGGGGGGGGGRDAATDGPVPIGFWIPDAAAMEGWSVRHDALPEHELEGHPAAAQHAARQLQAWLEEAQSGLNTFG